MVSTTEGDHMTKHKEHCQRVFKRYDLTCARCLELADGASPREWRHQVLNAADVSDIHAHFTSDRHTSGGCGIACTFGEW